MSDTRFDNGMNVIREHFGDQGEALIAKISSVSEDFARFNVEFPFGDLYSRPGLDQKTRELCAIAGLVCLGSALPQLKTHVKGAINCGASSEEILEVIIQMIAYAGFPAATNALLAAGEVLQAD